MRQRHAQTRWLASAFLVVVLLVLGACQPSAPTAQTSALDSIQQSKVVRIGIVNGNPPYSQISTSGTPEGYDIDIANAICTSLGAKCDFHTVDTAGRVTGLQTGQLDLTIADFSITPARALVVDFSVPYLVIHGRMITSANRTDINTFDDINKPSVRIASPRGSTSEPRLKAAFPQAQQVLFNNVADVTQAIGAGQADVAGIDDVSVGTFQKAHPGQFKVLPGSFGGGDQVGIGLPKGDYKWGRWIDTWVNQFNYSGQNATSFEKWFGFPLPSLGIN